MVRLSTTKGYSPPQERLDCSFSEVQGALVQMDHCMGSIRHRLDLLVQQLNLELPGVIRELLDQHGLSAEWIQDVKTLGNNTERFMMELADWVEALEAVIAQLREKMTLMERQVVDQVSSLLAELAQLFIEFSTHRMADNALILWSTSPEYLQLIHWVTQLEVVSQAECQGAFPLPISETREYVDMQGRLDNLGWTNEELVQEQASLVNQINDDNQQADNASWQQTHLQT